MLVNMSSSSYLFGWTWLLCFLCLLKRRVPFHYDSIWSPLPCGLIDVVHLQKAKGASDNQWQRFDIKNTTPGITRITSILVVCLFLPSPPPPPVCLVCVFVCMRKTVMWVCVKSRHHVHWGQTVHLFLSCCISVRVWVHGVQHLVSIPCVAKKNTWTIDVETKTSDYYTL